MVAKDGECRRNLPRFRGFGGTCLFVESSFTNGGHTADVLLELRPVFAQVVKQSGGVRGRVENLITRDRFCRHCHGQASDVDEMFT